MFRFTAYERNREFARPCRYSRMSMRAREFDRYSRSWIIVIERIRCWFSMNISRVAGSAMESLWSESRLEMVCRLFLTRW